MIEIPNTTTTRATLDTLAATNKQLTGIGQLRMPQNNDSAIISEFLKTFIHKDPVSFNYSPEEITDLLQTNGLHLMVQGNPANQILCLSMGYAGRLFQETSRKNGWHVSDAAPELNAPDVFYIEVKATHPDCQGKGLYRMVRSTQEVLAHQQGFNKIFLYSIPSAVEVHLKEGFQNLKEVEIISDKGTSKVHFMKLDLTPERYAKAKSIIGQYN